MKWTFLPPRPKPRSEPFKWGPVTLRPHPYYQFLYADGLQSNTNQVAHSIIQTISPGALLEIGRHWTLDYSPMWTIYSNNQFSDNFGQAIKLVGGTTYNDWVLGLIQSYAEVNAPSTVTASQTRTETYDTALNGSYTMNSKMSLDLSLNQNFVSADQFSSYNEWSTMDWLNYQFWPRLNAALGVGGGYDDEASSPDMTFEQFRGTGQLACHRQNRFPTSRRCGGPAVPERRHQPPRQSRSSTPPSNTCPLSKPGFPSPASGRWSLHICKIRSRKPRVSAPA